MPYFPALDGLRAVAILLVLALHGTYGHVSGGFVGVDIFFVLSGFLITRVLLQPRTTLAAFYIRRAQRLLPALACMLVLSLALWRFTYPSVSFLRAALPTAFYFADFRAMSAPESLGTMLPTWSLAIEEQFYLIWPLGLFAATKLSGRPSSRQVLMIAGLFSIVRAVLYFCYRPSVGYYSPLTRVDVLLVGCGIGLAADPGRFRLATWVFLGSLPAFAFRAKLTAVYFVILIPLIACGSGAVICECISREESTIKTVLSWRPLVWLGRRSYGIYLYHLAIFTSLEHLRRPGSIGNFLFVSVIRALAVVLFAGASYKFLERPILALQWGRKQARLVSRAD